MINKPKKILGVGVNYRSELSDDILDNLSSFDLIEVYTEKFFIKDDDPKLKKILQSLPLVMHGLDLSIGSENPLDDDYLSKLRTVLCENKHEWFSDHISLTKENKIEVGHLMPVQFSDELADKIIDKAKYVSSFSDKPFLLENITYYYQIPGGNLSEAEFVSRIIKQSGSGLLLDINNLYINSVNHQYDPKQFLSQLPLDHVVEIHLAGGSRKYNMLVDTHATNISKDVWDLFDYLVSITPVNAVIIERDSNLNVFSDLIDEVNIARRILKKHGLVGSEK